MSIKLNSSSIRANLAKLCMLVPLVYATSTNAATVTAVVPEDIIVGSDVQFSVNNVPWNTCSLNGRHFLIDATTDAGKNMYSILLAAQLGNRAIVINYTPSTRSGTTQNNGCTTNTMAKVSKIGIR